MSEQAQPAFSIEKIYLKDLSLEIPGAPQVFSEREAPKIDVNIHNTAKNVAAGVYEVVLTATITAKHGERTAFLVEAAQAGIFQIRNIPDEHMDPVLAITCPNMLYPYVREVVSSVIARAGFPPFMLNHLSFEALYQQHLQQREQQKQQAGDGAAPVSH
ncbi:MAG: protein-export chaperone SecB [Burkholderiales bacterium]|nr:protein-export chaperone SecB [Burkholderiales bacterium]